MKRLRFKILTMAAMLTTALAMVLSSNLAYACDIDVPNRRTEINIISNSFPLVNYMAEEMESCAEGRLRVNSRLTSEHVELTKLALGSGGRAAYQIIQFSTADFDEYVRRQQLLPITRYVERYRDQYNFDDIPQAMWDAATVDGEIYAIPIQQNLQHFFYRSDLFEKHGIAVPQTYQDVVRAAAIIQERENMRYPIAQAFGRGWNLATEFTNIYLSLGGEIFDDGLNPVFHTDGAGVEAIEVMQSMLPYMSPNALAFSTDDTMVAFQQGASAMGNMWATRAGNMDDEEVSRVVGRVAFSSAPAARSGALPASASWWDGYAIPANVNRRDRDLAFRIIAEATDEESMLGAGPLSFFSRSSVVSNPQVASGSPQWAAMSDTVNNGVRGWPGSPHFSIAHSALGQAVADALTGDISAREALNRAAAEYTTEATAKGFIQ